MVYNRILLIQNLVKIGNSIRKSQGDMQTAFATSIMSVLSFHMPRMRTQRSRYPDLCPEHVRTPIGIERALRDSPLRRN
jgi:hypothetical protein